MQSMTPQKLADLNEFSEADAWANYYQSAPERFVKKYGLVAKRIGSAWVTMIPGIDWTYLNRIVGLGLREPVTEAMLDDCIAVLEKAGCQNFMAQVCPLAQPAELLQWLENRGLVRRRKWVKVYRGNAPAPKFETNLRLVTVGREKAGAYAEVTLSAFEMPPELGPLMTGAMGKPGWYHYLGYDGSEPVSAGALYISGERVLM